MGKIKEKRKRKQKTEGKNKNACLKEIKQRSDKLSFVAQL
jgi:hypothetical protein